MKNSVSIHVLLCDTFPGLLPPEIPSYVSMFKQLFRSVVPEANFQVFRAMDRDLPATIEQNVLYLITGCNRSVYEQEPWILALLDWIRKAAAAKAFLVGICFGHQAIAQALGGKVEKYAGGWGVGIRASEILDSNLRRFFPSPQMHLLYNHHDQVSSLPTGAVVLASSSFCRYEAIRIGQNIFSFQGHPEYTPFYELHLLHNHAEQEATEVKERAMQTIREKQHEGLAVARFLLQAFSSAESFSDSLS